MAIDAAGNTFVLVEAVHLALEQSHGFAGGQPRQFKPDLPNVINDPVEALSGDILHGVIADTVVLAVVEDADDVGVVQPGGRAGLGVEPSEVVCPIAVLGMHHFESNVVFERLADGFVDDTHATFAKVAKNPVIAELLRDLVTIRRQRRGQRTIRLVACRLELFDQGQRGKEIADVVGMLGVALDVLGHATDARRGGAGRRTPRQAARTDCGRGSNRSWFDTSLSVSHRTNLEAAESSPNPSAGARISLSRRSART